jgi:hypothetical protein
MMMNRFFLIPSFFSLFIFTTSFLVLVVQDFSFVCTPEHTKNIHAPGGIRSLNPRE